MSLAPLFFACARLEPLASSSGAPPASGTFEITSASVRRTVPLWSEILTGDNTYPPYDL